MLLILCHRQKRIVKRACGCGRCADLGKLLKIESAKRGEQELGKRQIAPRVVHTLEQVQHIIKQGILCKIRCGGRHNGNAQTCQFIGIGRTVVFVAHENGNIRGANGSAVIQRFLAQKAGDLGGYPKGFLAHVLGIILILGACLFARRCIKYRQCYGCGVCGSGDAVGRF